jgi:transcriptional regulator GlxA family with amidase domain
MLQHVTIVGFRKALGTSITIPMEMLNAADLINRIAGSSPGKLHMQLASPDGNDLVLTAGLRLRCDTRITNITKTDLIIIPALWGNPLGVVKQEKTVLDWLRQQHELGTPVCAVGTGSWFLAEAGLLRQRVATTHWYYFDQFANQYPDVILQRERFITRAGNLYCAGSVNSVRDVMLYFIEESWSEEIANQVSRHFTHEIKRSYTSIFLRNSPQHYHDDESMIEIQDWLHSQYHAPITLEDISSKFTISIRTLNRRFRQATGKSPMQYLQQVRIDNAKELLRTTNLGIAEIAFSCGFSDCSYFSALFRKNISLTPSAYRNLVRKKLFRIGSSDSLPGEDN